MANTSLYSSGLWPLFQQVDFPIDDSIELLLQLQIVSVVEGTTDAKPCSEPPLRPLQYGLCLVPSPVLVLEETAMMALKGSHGDNSSVWQH